MMSPTLLLSVPVGALMGYGWHRLVGCRTGACPLTQTPLRAALYGAVVGALFALNGGST